MARVNGAARDDARIGALLRECTRGTAVEGRLRSELRGGRLDVDVHRLLAAAVHHRVTGFLYVALRDLEGVDSEVIATLRDRHVAGLGAHMRALADLSDLARVLGTAGVPWVVFKGPVLAELRYPAPELRRYDDLDILVPPARFRDAVRALESASAELLDHNWSLIAEEQRGQLHLRLRLGTVIDLHWDLVTRAHTRASLALVADELHDRAQPARLGGVAVRIFDPVDAVLHLCIHAGISGGDRLLWLKDIERSLALGQLDWDVLVRRARAWNASLLVGVMLERAQRWLDAAVPVDVTRALLPAGWRTPLAVVDRGWPPGARLAPAAVPAGLTRALRAGVPSTAAALVSHWRAQSRVRGIRRALGDTAGRQPAVYLADAHAPAEAREAYFSAVART